MHERAVELFAARGFDAVSAEEIAAAADVSPRTFFRYFPVKEDVVFAHEATMRETLATGLGAAVSSPAPLLAILDLLRESLATLSELSSPRMGELVAREPALSARMEQHALAHQRLVCDRLAEAVGPDPERRRTARLLGAALFGVLTEGRGEVAQAPAVAGAAITDQVFRVAAGLQELWDRELGPG